MAKGLSVRNYGFYGDLSRYEDKAGVNRIPRERHPAAKQLQVMWAADARLAPVTDPYFRSFDQGFPDYWLVDEWARDWLPRVAAGATPRLTLLRLAHDHFGDFAEAIDGVNTPDRQIADNDYAIGRVAEIVAKSGAGKDTLIAIVEDDAQNGADHVDAHRSPVFLIGPGVRRGVVVSTRYTTVNLMKTLERLLDLPPLGLNDSLALPMADAFDPKLTADWTYAARWSSTLDATDLPKPREAGGDAASGEPCARTQRGMVGGGDGGSGLLGRGQARHRPFQRGAVARDEGDAATGKITDGTGYRVAGAPLDEKRTRSAP